MLVNTRSALFFLTLISNVLAQASSSDVVDHGMDMDMDMSMELAAGQMLPYLHFQRGDVLWFEGWVPQSNGALAGTCVGLFLLAIFERWLTAMQTSAEAHWNKRAHIALINRLNTEGKTQTLAGTLALRTIPPFIPSHDIPRSLLHGAQSLLNFVFMLAAMTFNAGIIIAIVIGLGTGETLFGRYNASGMNWH